MTANLSPYIHLRGQAREALEFYAAALGGEASIMTFADNGGMGMPEEDQQLVMHGQVDAPGLLLMCSDTPSSMEHAAPAGFSVALSGDDDAVLRGWWDALAEGATIHVPLEVAPWGDAFGTLDDKFGVSWLVNIAGSGGAADAG